MSSKSGQTATLPASAVDRDAKVKCPRCAEIRGARVRRTGFLQKQVMPFFGYFPWECGACRFQWKSKVRGHKRKRRLEEEALAFVEPRAGSFEASNPEQRALESTR